MKKSNRNIILSVLALAIIFIVFMIVAKPQKNAETTFDSIKDIEQTDGNNLIYINIDGLSYSTYEKANQDPTTETKNINRLIERGVLFTNAKTGIPSITSSMQQSIVSGAWPIDTGNCYRYYDFGKEKVIQYSRENKLENIAQAANRNNIDLLSINSWYFEEKGSNEEKGNLYLNDPSKDGYKGRFKILKDVLNGEEVDAYGKLIKYDKLPQFISIYFDEVDEAAHNLENKANEKSKLAFQTRAEVDKEIVGNLHKIDVELGQIIDILEEKGLFEDMTFVITTDHGTVPFGADSKEEAQTKDYAFSQMPDLLETINSVGIKHMGTDFTVEMANTEGDKADKLSDVIVTSPGLQAQIRFREEPSEEFVEEILEKIKEKPYYGDHMTSDELRVRGVPPRFADLLITPKAPYHFSGDHKRPYYAVNQHDSLDERVQKIFTMISGPVVENVGEHDGEVYNIDMAPTMARILGFEGPKGATARVVDEVLIDKLKGPKLEVAGFKEDLKIVESDTETIIVETEPNSEISINRKKVGDSDNSGDFKIEKELKEGINRFIVESNKDEKITRRVVFVKKTQADKK